ncbi:MAG: anti-sigma factor [Phycisphaerales bacterium]|nr:anti-sigma factor [Phycisphaerales bacterium]
MSQERGQFRERALDLLIARSTCGLSHAEAEELRELTLIDAIVDPGEDAEIERAIDATRRAVMGGAAGFGTMPTDVRERVIRAIPVMAERAGAEPARNGSAIPISRGNETRAKTNWWPTMAAAAILLLSGVLVVTAWKPTGGGEKLSASAVVARLETAADRVAIGFKPGEGALAGATGEVVWSDTLQRGYMRIIGAKSNDPKAMQYQLWIVDPSRDKNPVDGGVFDIGAASSAGGAIIVPFESRLAVNGPKVFAITAEKPGGVVVSAGPLIMVAAR